MISRRGMVAGLVSGLAAGLATGPGGALAQGMDRSPLPPRRPGLTPAGRAPDDTERLVAAAKLGGAVGFVVADAATGEVLAQRQPDLPQPPASVLKAITALYALDRLGPGFSYATQVLATGPQVGGIVQGDLVVRGAGDPTVQTDQLGDLVARLAAAGLRGVTGRLLYWEGALPGLPEIATDQPAHVGYNPALSGLNLNYNRVHFEWRRAGGDWAVAMDARGERFVPAVRGARVRVVGRDAPLFTYDASAAAEEWTVASAALGKGGARWLPVRRPGAYLAEVFRVLAAAQGITLPAGQPVAAPPAGTVLAALQSEPLPQVLRDMLKFSTNLTAECVGLRVSGAAGLAASGAAMTGWAAQRMGVAGRFVDHSGLGRDSRITPAAMARALVWARAGGGSGGGGGGGGALQAVLRSYPMRDDTGAEIASHPARVLAKSGTLNFASGLAGYILRPSGRDLVFAVFSADVARREALSEAQREDPEGGAAWTRRARRLQGQLINRWSALA